MIANVPAIACETTDARVYSFEHIFPRGVVGRTDAPVATYEASIWIFLKILPGELSVALPMTDSSQLLPDPFGDSVYVIAICLLDSSFPTFLEHLVKYIAPQVPFNIAWPMLNCCTQPGTFMAKTRK